MQRRTTTPRPSRPSPCPTDEPLATIALTAGSPNRWHLRPTSRLGLKALERRESVRKVGLPERRIDISGPFASVGSRRHMPERRREAPCWWHAPAGACRASGLVLPAKPALPTWVASNETGRRGFSVCLYFFFLFFFTASSSSSLRRGRRRRTGKKARPGSPLPLMMEYTQPALQLQLLTERQNFGGTDFTGVTISH